MVEDGVYVHSGGSQRSTLRGRDAVAAWVSALNEMWSSDYALEQTFAFATDQAFVIEYAESGTADLGPNALDRSFSLHNVFVGELQDGRITRITDYADMLAYKEQVELDQ